MLNIIFLIFHNILVNTFHFCGRAVVCGQLQKKSEWDVLRAAQGPGQMSSTPGWYLPIDMWAMQIEDD